MGDPDVEAVTDLVRGAWYAMAARAMVELALPELAAGPVTLSDLARACRTPPRELVRLLRLLDSLGLMTGAGNSGSPGETWQVTPRGALLRADHPQGLSSLLLNRTWSPTIEGWSRLAEALRTGERTLGRGVASVEGTTLWEAMSRVPEQARIFNARMAVRGRHQATALLECVDLGGVAVVVDVGGGRGAMLASLLERREGLTGVLADQPGVVLEAEQTFAEAGLSGRCSTVPVDFFASLPPGGDAYVLANILHDWSDADCRRLLAVVRAAMVEGAVLWVLEQVLDPDPPRSAAYQRDLQLLDLHMLVSFGAQERTRSAYRELLADAGFQVRRITAASTGWDVLEAHPVSGRRGE